MQFSAGVYYLTVCWEEDSVQPAFFAACDLFTLTRMYRNKVRSLILVFVVRIWQTVSFLTILFRRNTAALTDSNSIVLIRLRKHVSIQTRFCIIRVNAFAVHVLTPRALMSQ